MALPFFYSTPVNAPRTQFTVRTAIEQLQSFNSVYNKVQAALDAGTGLGGLTVADLSRWNAFCRDGIVNIGGKPVDYNFFVELMGGQLKEAKASDLYVEYNSAIDWNVYAASDVTGSGPGGYVDFTIAPNGYSPDGNSCNLTIGNQIYINQDMRWLTVSNITVIAPFNILVRAYAMDASYTPNVYANMAMTVIRTQQESGYSTINNSNVQWETPGYVTRIQPWDLRVDWETPFDLDEAYQKIMNFAIWVDPITGKAEDIYDFKIAQEKRIEFQMSKNLFFWNGQKDNNQANLNSAGVRTYYTNKYNGFDGLIPSIMYGGGQVRPYDNVVGWDLDTDWTNIILELDATKLSDEYLLMISKPFNMSMQRRVQDAFKNTSGSLMMKTFERMGADSEAIKRLGVQSWNWLGATVHIKELGFLTDSRLVGHGYFPDMGLLMPGYGMADSNGVATPPIEMWKLEGTGMNGSYIETLRDMRKIDGSTRFTGTIEEKIMMSVNGVENMFLLLPETPSA